MATGEGWVDIAEVAAHLHVTKDSIYRWIDTKGFPARRVGRLLRFRLSEVDEWSYDGGRRLLRIGLQAYSLGIAYEFDPYYGLSISRVDPLPHQLEAVYEHLLKLPSLRFLLADDAGAGKTIMAGLLVRELKLRGLIERVLVVCPANPAFQWQRELKEKFDEKFLVLKGSDIRDQFGVNQWMEQIITPLDFAKRAEILPALRQVHWDLVIVDEAHRMSSRDETHKSQCYRLGELLRDSTDHVLLLTATPHKRDPQNFTLFLQLLDQDAYADVRSIREAMDRRRAPFYLRRTKEAMVYFPERETNGEWTAKPVFTNRIPRAADFAINGPEFEFYQKVTRFVKRQSARAAAEGDDPRARAVGFLMSLYQRRLASSTYAMRRSPQNRARRLEDGLKRAQELVRKAPADLANWEKLDEFEDAERERLESEELKRQRAVTLQGASSAWFSSCPTRNVALWTSGACVPNPETEMTAMRVVMDYERAQGRQVYDVHEKNLGYDVTSLDLQSGELRLIEVKGLAAATGSILLTLNERRVAEDRRDCFWLYVVTNCGTTPELQEPIKDPPRFPWREVTKVQHYWLDLNAMAHPMEIREDGAPYRVKDTP